MTQGEPTSIYSLVTPIADEESPAHRLLLGLEQARMATRLGLEPDRVLVGRFVLERLVGRGGMGMVFAAHDPALERTVALKVMSFDSVRGRRFTVAEARALARLSHPNIVAVFEAGVDDELAYVVMEFIHGQSLREWLCARRRSVAELLPVFVAAGRGLAAAHAEGLLHRDFKPDNVLVGADGRVRVADFGLAREQGDDAGSRAGTPAYMAPEQVRGEPATAASDQFAFCMALWEGCCAARPYTIEGLQQLAFEQGQPPRVPEGVELPAALSEALKIGLDRDPQLRWPDMDTLIDALEQLRAAPKQQEPRAIVGVDPWTQARLRRERRLRVMLGVASAGLVAVSALVGWWLAELPEPRSEEDYTPAQQLLSLSLGGHESTSGMVALAARHHGQVRLLDAVFGFGMMFDPNELDTVSSSMESASLTRTATRRMTAQVCIHAYLSVGEARLESSTELALCRLAVGFRGPPTALGTMVTHDDRARFSQIFGLFLDSYDPAHADGQHWRAENHRCDANRYWQHHLEGLPPPSSQQLAGACGIDPGQSGPRPDECVAYAVVEDSSSWVSEPVSSGGFDG